MTRSGDEKQAILARWLKTKAYLVVVDNLETTADYQSLLPLLQQLANPSKFLLTSRHSLRGQANVYCHRLRGFARGFGVAPDVGRHPAGLPGKWYAG